MSKYIIDVLGDVDEELLEEALELPRQGDEIIFESNERHRRSSIIAATAAIAASLAVVAGVILFRANFGRISALPNESGSTDISEPDTPVSGIVIPNDFTENDKELQQILNEIDDDALKVCKMFGYYSERSYSWSGSTIHFLFPQMAQPLTFQLDKYPYFATGISSSETLNRRLASSFTKETAGKFSENLCKGDIVEVDSNFMDFTINITEGGEFDENGYLTGLPELVEAGGSLFRRKQLNGRDFSGFWSTAKVISRTDDEIVFSYIYEFDGELYETKGRLVNENGWKFSWYEDWIF